MNTVVLVELSIVIVVKLLITRITSAAISDGVEDYSNGSNGSPTDSVQKGVPVDFGYRDTNSSSDVNHSAPGCPTPKGGLPWIYHGNSSGYCYLVGTEGPCPPGKLLFLNETLSYWGYCDCPCSLDMLLHPEIKSEMKKYYYKDFDMQVSMYPSFVWCKVQDIPELNEAVYDMQRGACYFLDTRGPCQPGEWLVKENEQTTGNITCVPQCSPAVGPFQSSNFYDSGKRKCGLKLDTSVSQPVSLAGAMLQQGCEEGMIYSKTLQKCIAKSKAFFMMFTSRKHPK